MKKLCVLIYSIGIIGISLYGLSNNSYYVQLLMNLSKPYMLFRITLVLCLVAYAYVPQLRLYTTRFLFGSGGAVLLVLGMVAIYSPTLLGHISGYILFGDSLSIIEGGILAIVLSAELSARRSRIMAASFLSLKKTISNPIQIADIFFTETHGNTKYVSLNYLNKLEGVTRPYILKSRHE